MKRHTSIHKIPNGKTYSYPDWYYKSLDLLKKSRKCRYCGSPIEGKGLYCSFECKRHWDNWAGMNSLSTNSVRREVHKRFDFECVDCGKRFSQKLESGAEVPRFRGHCHHIIPLGHGYNGKDDFNNMTLLCPDCHREIHHAKDLKIHPIIKASRVSEFFKHNKKTIRKSRVSKKWENAIEDLNRSVDKWIDRTMEKFNNDPKNTFKLEKPDKYINNLFSD